MNNRKYTGLMVVAIPFVLFLAIAVLRLYTNVLAPVDAVRISWNIPDAVWHMLHLSAGVAPFVGPALYWWGLKRDGAVLTAIFYGAGAAGLMAKAGFSLPRPLGSSEIGYGYPSGSSQNAVVGWGFPTRYWKPWIYVAVAVSFAVGLSRLGRGDHYVTDVIGGWLLGIAALYLAFYICSVQFPEELWKRWVLIVVFCILILAVGWNVELVPEYMGMVMGFLLGYSMMRMSWEPASKLKGSAVILLGIVLGTLLRNSITHISEGTFAVVISTIAAGLWMALCPGVFVRVKLLRVVL
ncbi:MAG: phosphatase PAP2 family protein [Theionarchaea archaeon]|nr:phosphatase PAP2 family protein [Theionarchaea archaeon]